MLQAPAGFRGVSEFTDVRWLYEAVMESPDPRLISIGPAAPLPIRRTAGAPTSGLMTFMHRGEGGLFDVGYGIAPAWLTGHDRPFQYFTRTQVRVPSHPASTLVAVDIPPTAWPSNDCFCRVIRHLEVHRSSRCLALLDGLPEQGR